MTFVTLIGGPLDGQRVQVTARAENYDWMQLPLYPESARSYADMLAGMEPEDSIGVATYRRVDVRDGSRVTSRWVHESIADSWTPSR